MIALRLALSSLLLLLTAGFLLTRCGPPQPPTDKKPELPAIDLTACHDTVALFARGRVSTPLFERDMAISPDGTEIIYTLGDPEQLKRCLVRIRKTDGKWGQPEVLNISGRHQDIEPFFAPDGQRLYFASNRPTGFGYEVPNYNIWYSPREGDHWGKPVVLDTIINGPRDEFFPSVANNGNLYFTATRPDGVGLEDIFVSRMVDGNYTRPEPLDTAINSKRYEFNAYVSPDESVIVFTNFGRADGHGGGDLYFSRKDSDGNWQPSINLGLGVNSNRLDYCPFIDWEQRNLYFTSDRVLADTFDVRSAEDLRQFTQSIQNGLGNIYRVCIDIQAEVEEWDLYRE